MRKIESGVVLREDRGAFEELSVAEETLTRAVERLGGRAGAVFAKTPLIDPHLPEVSDLDLLAVGDADDFYPERLVLGSDPATSLRVDLIWLPRRKLDDLQTLAKLGLVGHRLLSSTPVFDLEGFATQQHAALRTIFDDRQIQKLRIAGFLEMGFLTVQEIGVTWDFPALALFWLHMAHAACLAAALDGAGELCPNIFTRPLDSVGRAEDALQIPLESEISGSLRLHGDIQKSTEGLRRIHDVVSHSFPEPEWPDRMRILTRYEFRYFASRSELEWRIRVAEAMARRGSLAAAVFYLRFWAYALARIPMVHRRALEGRDVSFVRPSRAVLPELRQLCPEILDDLTYILDSGENLSEDDIKDSLESLGLIRRQTLEFLDSRGLHIPGLKLWRPYEAPEAAMEMNRR